jgi:hypothetical protein
MVLIFILSLCMYSFWKKLKNQQNKPTLPVVEASEQLKIIPEALNNNKNEQQLLIYGELI